MKLSFPASLLLIAAPAWAQFGSPGGASAQELLRQVAEAYRSLNSFEWAAILIITTDSGEFRPQPSFFLGQFQRPHRMRIDFQGQPIPRSEVIDGRVILLYYPSRRGFCRPDPGLSLRPAPHEAMTALGWSLPQERIVRGLKRARILGHRELRVGGRAVNCVVVAAVYEPALSPWTGVVHTTPITYWIDPETKIVVQQSYRITRTIPGRRQARTDTATVSLLRYHLNPKVPDARFAILPREGVAERPCLAFSSGG